MLVCGAELPAGKRASRAHEAASRWTFAAYLSRACRSRPLADPNSGSRRRWRTRDVVQLQVRQGVLPRRRYGAALGPMDEADGATFADVRLDLCDGVAPARGGQGPMGGSTSPPRAASPERANYQIESFASPHFLPLGRAFQNTQPRDATGCFPQAGLRAIHVESPATRNYRFVLLSEAAVTVAHEPNTNGGIV